MMGRGVYVKLTERQIAHADDIATQRREAATAKGRVHTNNGNVNMEQEIRGARCELAGKVYLDPIEWHAFADNLDDLLPDLGRFIDVKGVKRDDHSLIVQKPRLKPSWAYLMVSAEEHPYYWIAGWMWGRDIGERFYGDKARRGTPAYFVPSPIVEPDIMLPPSELRRAIA